MAFPIPAARADGRNGTSETSHVISLTGLGTISAGDGLLLAITDDGGDTITFPSTGEVWTGFIDRRSAPSGSGHCRIAVAYRKATGGETTLTVTTGGNESTVWRLWRFDAADIADWDTDPPEGSHAEASPNPTLNPDPPSHTVSWATGEDNWWGVQYGSDGNKRATVYPSNTTDGFTNGSLDISGGACAIGIAERYDTALDTWDPSAFTLDNDDNCSVATFAVRPAAAGGGLTATINDGGTEGDTVNTQLVGSSSAMLSLLAAMH